MPTLFTIRRTSETDPASERTTVELPDVKFPQVKRPEVKLPQVDLQDIKLPQVDLPEIEVPKVDVGKTVLGVATAAGLVKPRRSRWPYLLGVGVVVAVVGWALTNTAIRDRLTQAVGAIRDRVQAMRGTDQSQDAIAFPAAHAAPIDEPANLSVPPASNPDYPEGFGAENETRSTTASLGNNGHETATAPR